MADVMNFINVDRTGVENMMKRVVERMTERKPRE